jgi:histidinol-phosphate aminotransferase
MEFNPDNIARENIKLMTPYSSARHEFTGEASIFLDANENSFGSPLPVQYNRYPDPNQTVLKDKLSSIKGIASKNIFIGNGSDEAIDLLMRIFCEPGRDNVVLLPPTYGMYEVCAQVNDVKTKKVPLLESFQPDMDAIASAIDPYTKLIFVCSPNNPTGNSIDREAIEILLNNFDGLVVIDEAYINFSKQRSFITELPEYPNLVVMQTLSKAWGLAGLRIGMAFASEAIIAYMNKVKYPYNISEANQQLALEALENLDQVNEWTRQIVQLREGFSKSLANIAGVMVVYPSDANFVLVKMGNAKKVYQYLVNKGIIVRDRSNVMLCDDCLRVTIGTPGENQELLISLKTFKP